jgi:hypothetical protein
VDALRVADAERSSVLEWGVASSTHPGERTSGDLHVICHLDDGVLVAVVDGVGHGDEAAAAARIAAATIERYHADSVIALARRCHAALLGTRGVAMSLARFSSTDDTMTWLAIGNVDGVLVRSDPGAGSAREAIMLRGGVVGSRLPPLQATVVAVSPNDVLVFATDGIDAAFTAQVRTSQPPQRIADSILTGFAKGTDDALVLAARYLGPGGKAVP